MDASPLMHQVNRAHRLKVTFPVCGRRYAEMVLADNPTLYLALSGIHRSGSPEPPEMLSLDHFLAFKVLKLGPNVFTVGDLISISANVLGGVHKGTPRTEEEQALQGFNQVVKAFGLPISAAQMMPIVLVALDGLARIMRERTEKTGEGRAVRVTARARLGGCRRGRARCAVGLW